MFNTIITLHPLEHWSKSQVRLAFPFDGVVKEHIKQLSTVRWSQTHRCFYMSRFGELTAYSGLTDPPFRKVLTPCDVEKLASLLPSVV